MKRTTYTGTRTRELSFPLGGIGTGSVGLAGNGGLIDWEIWGRPNKGTVNGHTHFAVKAEKDGKPVDARVICGDIDKNLNGQTGMNFGFGLSNTTMEGFPHFRNCVFEGEFPIATLSFSDEDSPAEVKLTAFNPLIPHHAKESSIPAAFFSYTVTNRSADTLNFSVAATLKNPVAPSHNRVYRDGSTTGVFLRKWEEDKFTYGDMTLATDAEDISYQENWYRGGWFDNLETYWRNFTEQSRFKNRHYEETGKGDCATLCVHHTLAPSESFTVRYVIAWYYPVKPDQWNHGEVRNYYSYLYASSKEVAGYCLAEWDRLYTETAKWRDELFASTLPEEVIEAVSATSSVLKTETCLRVGEKGDFYGWEGLGERNGSCPGTCTHVWNYAYALPFLFPDLERGIRENDYLYNQRPSGEMIFRTIIPFGSGIGGFRACVDGQMGGIMKVYREWKLCGDTEWLRSVWDGVKKSLEYAWSEENYDRWDRNKDGVMEGRQHHTLDMELFEASSWLEGFYLGALKAAAEMAEALGDTDADEYRSLFEKGYAYSRDNLFNGKYFMQKIDLADRSLLEGYDSPADNSTMGGTTGDAVSRYWNEETGEIKYQIGEGSEIDQLLAQWHADISGLGDLFDREQVHTALDNMYKNNFKESMRNHYNTFRLFAVNDEAGAIICEWTKDVKKPAIPIPYAQESMHGFEYAFAGLLISRGYLNEGLRVVRGIRDRYNGEKRNPWNEVECGSNYARSMASFALLPIISGMKFDMTRNELGFKPVCDTKNGFRCVWAVSSAWGNIVLGKETALHIVDGELTLKKLTLPLAAVSRVLVDGQPTTFTFIDGTVVFDTPVTARNSIEIL